jgi:hypothetical protein
VGTNTATIHFLSNDPNKPDVAVRVRFIVSEQASNHAPLAANDAATITNGTAVTVNVLANDRDPDWDTLTVSAVTPPTWGIVVNHGSNVTYSVVGGYTGADGFTYTVSDGQGGLATGRVSVTIGVWPPLEITGCAMQPGSKWVITWAGVPGRFYRIQTTTNLLQGFQDGGGLIQGTGLINCYTVQVDQAVQQFLRAVEEP